MKRMEASRGSCVRKTLAAIPLLAVALCVSGANAIAPRPAMDELNNQLASASPGAFAPPIKQTERAIRPGGSGSALQSGSSDDTSTETTTLEYETPTHFIIIVIVVVYDERGNVLDVRTHTFTVPKAGREIAPAPAGAPPPPLQN